MPDAMVPTATLDLSTANSNVLVFVARRLRELAVEAQQRRGCGHIRIDVLVDNGTFSRDIRVNPDWRERL